MNQWDETPPDDRHGEDEDRRITEAARSDPDNPPLSDEELDRLARTPPGPPPEIRRMMRRRGPQKAPRKIPVTLRLAPDLAESYRLGEPGFTARVEEALRRAAQASKA